MITLRPYQQQAIHDIRAALARHRRVLYQLPTGGGKTTIFCEIARLARAPLLILVHRQELLLQASAALQRAGVPHQVVAPRHVAALCSPTPAAPVVLATVQSAARRPVEPAPALIVMDEAHHAVAGSWAAAARRWPAARIVGFSATPCRLDGQGLADAFDELLCGPTVGQLVAEGHLAPVVAYSVARVDMVGIRETDAAAVGKRVAPVVGCAVDHWATHGRQRPAIAFCHSVEAARSLAERFRGRGAAAACLDGQMAHEDRQRVVAGLRSGELQVLTSCEIVSEGFDVPGVEVAILLRPTASLSLYLQQIGRAMRPAPGKPHGIVIDAVGNLLRHGLPDDPRRWSLQGAAVHRTTVPGEVPVVVRTCPECYRCFAPATHCPYCATPIPPRPREVELVDGVLREWTRAELAAERERQRLAARDEVRRAARQGLAALLMLEAARGYSKGWARKYWSSMRR